MIIVGVGAGAGMLMEEGISRIRAAKRIYGSDRALELARGYAAADAVLMPITDYAALRGLPADAMVLSTGDPLMAGLGYLPGEVVPGISSMQAAFARLKVSWTNVAVVNAHGKDHASADVRAGHSVFVIADPDFSVAVLAASLPPGTRVAVCEDLGYPSERVAEGTAEHTPVVQSRLFCVVAGY